MLIVNEEWNEFRGLCADNQDGECFWPHHNRGVCMKIEDCPREVRDVTPRLEEKPC